MLKNSTQVSFGKQKTGLLALYPHRDFGGRAHFIASDPGTKNPSYANVNPCPWPSVGPTWHWHIPWSIGLVLHRPNVSALGGFLLDSS